MAYANKVAETAPKEIQKNPPDAKPDDWRNPWKGAAIGGTLGGLVTTALGYLYGHRGRWLAYDAIAGGGTGAAIGYGVDAHNNAKAEERPKEMAISGPSVEAENLRKAKDLEMRKMNHQKAVQERKEVNSRGGYANWWANFLNKMKGGEVEDYDEWQRRQRYRDNVAMMTLIGK